MTMTPIRIEDESGGRARHLLSARSIERRGEWGFDESLPAIEAAYKGGKRIQELVPAGCASSWESLIHDALREGDRSTMASLLAHPSFPFVQKNSGEECSSDSWLPTAIKPENIDMFWDIVAAAAAAPCLDGASIIEQGMFREVGSFAYDFEEALAELAMSPENEGAVEWLLNQDIFTEEARAKALLSLSQQKGNARMIKIMAPFADCEARGSLSENLQDALARKSGKAPREATPLCFSAWAGDVEAVRVLLPLCNPRGIADAGMTALMFAAQEGHVEVVKELARAGHCAARNKEGSTALMFACEMREDDEDRQARKKTCALILAETSPVEAVNEKGAAALMLSVVSRQWDLALRLSEYEEAWSSQDQGRNMAAVAALGDPESNDVKMLLDKFRSMENWAERDLRSPSVPRAAERNDNPKMFDLLIGDAEPFDLVGGARALWLRLGSLLERQAFRKSSAKHQQDALDAWLANKPQAPADAPMGELLALAIETNSSGWVELLLPVFVERQGQEGGIEEKMPWRDRPLSAAARNGRADLVSALFPKKGTSHQQLVNGKTALMEAAERGFLDCVRVLLSRDSGIEALSSDGDPLEEMTALGHALAAGSFKCAEELVLQGASGQATARKHQGSAALLTHILGGVKESHDNKQKRDGLRRCLGLALEVLAEPVRGYPGKTVLMEAAAAGDWESIKTILGAKPSLAGARDALGRTALMNACLARSVECVRLLSLVEDVNERDEEGATALFLAIGELCRGRKSTADEKACLDVVYELVERTDLDARDYRNVSLDELVLRTGVSDWRPRVQEAIRARREREDLMASTMEAPTGPNGAKGRRI